MQDKESGRRKNSSSTGTMSAPPEYYSIGAKGFGEDCALLIARSGDEWPCCPSLGDDTKASCRLQRERMLPQEIHVEIWNIAKIMGPMERWRSPGSLTGSHPLQIDMLARTRLHEIVLRSSLLPSVCVSAAVTTAYHL